MSQTQPMSPGQRKKLTPLEFHDAVLRMINTMNMEINAASSKITSLTASAETIHEKNLVKEILAHHTKVLNGVTSLTSIFTEARQRALVDEASKQGQGHQALGVQDDSAGTGGRQEAISEVARQAANVAQTFQKDTQGIAERVTDLTSSLPAQTAVIGRRENSLDRLIGDDGILFDNLSMRVNPLGRGALAPDDRLLAFIEDITDISTEDLVHYPEGFYATRDGKPTQLYLISGRIGFLWMFGETRDLLFRDSQGEWASFQTLSKNTSRLMGEQLVRRVTEIIEGL